MSRPHNTEERRRQIAAGLVQVMATRGYDGATIAEIAKAAGLTPGLVHYHFDNKQQILLAALDDLVARHEAELDRHLAAAKGGAGKVAAFIDVHLGLGATADPEALACWILLGGEALRQPPVQQRYAAAIASLVARVKSLIRRGIEEGAFPFQDAADPAAAIVAAIQGYYMLAAAARDTIPRGSAARCTLRMAEGVLHTKIRLGPEEDSA